MSNVGMSDIAMTELEDILSRLSILEVPFEVMEHILKHVPTSRDILNFALASKTCYDHALPMLYRNVDWIVGNTHPQKCVATLRGMHFLLAHPELLSVTRSLRVSEKQYDVGNDTRLPLDFSGSELALQPTRKTGHGPLAADRNFPQTFRTASTVLAMLPRFTGLTELTLRSITLPRTFYQSVHALSDNGLRRLTLRHVRPTTRYPRGYNPATLQLTELSLFHVYTRTPKLKALLKLARSPMLRTLRFDCSLERALRSLAEHGLPPSVRSLELDFRWSTRAARSTFEPLFAFLNTCAHVRHLELTDMGKLDSNEQHQMQALLTANALPALTSIAVPFSLLGLLLPGRAIDSVTITDTTFQETYSTTPMLRFLTVGDVAEILKTLQISSISLQSLKFNLRQWDKELFYMLAAKQSKLKELHVAYQYGEANDEFFMTLGNLLEFPQLERLHLYRFGDKMAGSDDDKFVDHKEYMIIWQLYMPGLCEVALSPDIVWVKSPVLAPLQRRPAGRRFRPTWSPYAVEPMDGVEGLVVIPCPKEAKKYEARGKEGRSFRDRFVNPVYHPAVQHEDFNPTEEEEVVVVDNDMMQEEVVVIDMMQD